MAATGMPAATRAPVGTGSVRHADRATAIRIADKCAGIARRVAPIALLVVSALPAWAESDVTRGEALVRTNCSPCHAVGANGTSPHPDAPAFRALSARYPIEDLAEALAEGISTGHPDMPEFVATPDQIDAIIAYI